MLTVLGPTPDLSSLPGNLAVRDVASNPSTVIFLARKPFRVGLHAATTRQEPKSKRCFSAAPRASARWRAKRSPRRSFFIAASSKTRKPTIATTFSPIAKPLWASRPVSTRKTRRSRTASPLPRTRNTRLGLFSTGRVPRQPTLARRGGAAPYPRVVGSGVASCWGTRFQNSKCKMNFPSAVGFSFLCEQRAHRRPRVVLGRRQEHETLERHYFEDEHLLSPSSPIKPTCTAPLGYRSRTPGGAARTRRAADGSGPGGCGRPSFGAGALHRASAGAGRPTRTPAPLPRPVASRRARLVFRGSPGRFHHALGFRAFARVPRRTAPTAARPEL